MNTCDQFIEILTNIKIKFKSQQDLEKQCELAKNPYSNKDFRPTVDGYLLFMHHPRIFTTTEEKFETALCLLNNCNILDHQAVKLILCFNGKKVYQQLIVKEILKFRSDYVSNVYALIKNLADSRKEIELSSLHIDTAR